VRGTGPHLLIIRTKELGGDWTFAKAKKKVVEPKIGHIEWWTYPTTCVSKDATAMLARSKFPYKVHIVLQTGKNQYFLMREAELIALRRKSGRRPSLELKLKLGSLVFVDPNKYKTIVRRTRFSWFGQGRGHQMVHLTDRDYEKDVKRAPIAEGKIARFLFYNNIERRLIEGDGERQSKVPSGRSVP